MPSIKQPVVWCSDPNSTNQKPTAFALHGIQFEGIITEQHVLALRELINAAAEGRLLLPSNGAIVLLDCGIDVNSNTANNKQTHKQRAEGSATVIASLNIGHRDDVPMKTSTSSIATVQTDEKQINDHQYDDQINESIPIDIDIVDADESSGETKTIQLIKCDASAIKIPDTNKFEPKYSEFQVPALSKYDFIYEFLCCAKCINQQPANALNEKQRMVNGAWSRKKSCRHRVINNCTGDQQQQQQQQSQRLMFNLENNLCHFSGHINRSSIPIYATINTKLRRKNVITAQQKNSQKNQSKHAPIPEIVLNSSDEVIENDGCNNECDSFNVKIEENGDKDAVIASTNSLQQSIETKTVMKQRPSTDDDRMPTPNKCVRSKDVTEQETDANTCDVQLKVTNNSMNASRKTSFDSSCTVGSMDSGFIEMQNRLEATTTKDLSSQSMTDTNESNDNIISTSTSTSTMTRDVGIADASSGITMNQYDHTNKDNVLLKECSTQSRNRRKSYEEFKAIYHNRMTLESDLPFVQEHEQTTNLLVSNKKEKIKARRKSYEEFKALVRECGSEDTNELKRKKSKQYTKTATKVLATMNETDGLDESTEKSEQQQQEKQPQKQQQKCSSKASKLSNSCDVLVKTTSAAAAVKTKQDIYKTNFKMYDKLISYGTIYDIMQKKTDIYKAYRKYDAYMTYGTIYEILQRKSDESDLFQRTRANSEKFLNKRIGGSGCAVDEKSASTPAKDDENRTLNFGAIYDIIQRKHRQSEKTNSLPNGVIGAIEMAKMSDAEMKTNSRNRGSDGCIYDIINQSQLNKMTSTSECGDEHLAKQFETPCSSTSSSASSSTLSSSTLQPNVINNRFLVEKVNENELSHTKAIECNQMTSSSASAETKANSVYVELPTETMATGIASSTPSSASSLLAKWNSPRLDRVKKSNRMRRFSHALSYTQRLLPHENETSSCGTNTLKVEPCTESHPQTIDEDVDVKQESPPIRIDSNHNAFSNSKLTQTNFGHRNEVRTKKVNKFRKLSSPLPMNGPPTIVPRKLSAPPPPLPPPSSMSFHLLTQQQQQQQQQSHCVKNSDSVGNSNEQCAKSFVNEHTANDSHSATGNDCNNDNNNNNSSSKNENCNHNDTSEHDQSNESENISKCKQSRMTSALHSDAKLLKCKQIASIRPIGSSANANETTKTAMKRTTVNDKKAKSRRLSEFTRGEFLNEKL